MGKHLENTPNNKKSWMTTATLGLLIVLIYALARLQTVQAEGSKTVYLTINGLTDTYTTQSATVGEFITNLNLPQPVLKVIPAQTEPISDQMHIILSTQPAKNSEVTTNLQTTIQKVQEEVKKKQDALKVPKSPVYEGVASWYVFGTGMNTASRQFPRKTKLRVVAINSGKYVDVVVNDYGPEDWTGVDLDLNRPAFAKIAPLGAGIVAVKYYKI